MHRVVIMISILEVRGFHFVYHCTRMILTRCVLLERKVLVKPSESYQRRLSCQTMKTLSQNIWLGGVQNDLEVRFSIITKNIKFFLFTWWSHLWVGGNFLLVLNKILLSWYETWIMAQIWDKSYDVEARQSTSFTHWKRIRDIIYSINYCPRGCWTCHVC